jgi:lipocalin
MMGTPVSQFTTDWWFPFYDHGYPNIPGDNMRTWVLVGNPSASQTATVNITIGGTLMSGSPFSIAPGNRVTPRWIGTVGTGPVHVHSDIPVFASERVFTAPYNSFNEMMGYPANQFTSEYWFPYYDSVSMSTYLKVGNTSSTQTANVDIYIGATKKGSYTIPHDQTLTQSYASVVDGPVRVVSTNGVNVVASEWTLSGTSNSFNEIMGYPFNQFDTDYWFPYYDHGYPAIQGDNMRTWVLVGNPSTTETATVNITIGGALQTAVPFSIGPGSRVTPRWIGLVGGPVHVSSNIPVFASERVLTVPSNSFNEMMGYPATQFTTEYWFPWYDSVNMPNSISISRP